MNVCAPKNRFLPNLLHLLDLRGIEAPVFCASFLCLFLLYLIYMTEQDILDRHRQTLKGKLMSHRLKSAALRVYKNFYIYEPPYYGHPSFSGQVSLLYLFRGHEREYVNLYEDGSRKMVTTIELLDQLIVAGILPPLVAIMPGLNSENNHVPSLGIDMVGSWERAMKGLGTGKFYQYLTKELIPYIETRYAIPTEAKRMAAGFSLGGYTVSMLAAKLAGFFHHVGIYDGTIMWQNHRDPRYPDADGIWKSAGIFEPALGKPRNQTAMKVWNSTDLIAEATGETLENLRKTRFWVASAAFDGMRGNRERCEYFAKLLTMKGIPLGWENVPFDPAAEHDWYWNNQFVMRFLHHVLRETT